MRKLKTKKSMTAIMAVGLALLVLAAAPASAGGTFSGSGTVNSIDAARHKINITHGPISELKWPGMTMDFTLAEGVSLEKIMVGAAIDFELRKRADGSFVIESLKTTKMPEHSHGH